MQLQGANCCDNYSSGNDDNNSSNIDNKQASNNNNNNNNLTHPRQHLHASPFSPQHRTCRQGPARINPCSNNNKLTF